MAENQAMDERRQEYLTEHEAKSVIKMFRDFLKLYKGKNAEMSDQQWLEMLFRRELPELKEEEIKQESEQIVTAIKRFDENLASCNEAAQNGISKESWLADKLQESSVGMSVNEYGKTLAQIDKSLYEKNMELANALSRSEDGHIMMSPNLDGNIAEHMIADSAELSAVLQGKNVSVEVLNSHAANSVDVRAKNLDTGEWQNYQLKFGKDARATIDLLERGNYNNQRIIVPSEQLEEVQAHFQAKGSSKTITDHIEAWGAKGKSFTKEDMKALQENAQSQNTSPAHDWSHYQTKDLALNIGKNAGVMGILSAAVTTGFHVVSKIFKGEKIDKDELVENAIKTGVDTSVKTVAAGTLTVAVKKGILKCISKATPAGVIANIACVGIENVKVLAKVASGELSVTKGIDQMGRVTTSTVGGLCGMAKGATVGAGIGAAVPILGAPLAVAGGLVGGMVGYFAGSKAGDVMYEAVKKVASGAKAVGKAAIEGIKAVGEGAVNVGKSIVRGIANLFGL